jgi:hypothetical protein
VLAVTDALVVDLNRSSHHAIEPASDSFETDGPFVVRVENHGEGSHVHCSITGDLATTATVTEGNPFLEPDEVVEIPVDVRTDLRPARGSLELSTGYGRESVSIEVLVRTSDSVPTSPIERDRTGATSVDAEAPQSAAKSSGRAGDDQSDGPVTVDRIADSIRSALPRRDVGTALLAALALLAIAIAIVAWQVIDGLVVYFAVMLVVATVLGAVVALVRE